MSQQMAPSSPEAKADDAIRAVLLTQWNGEPALRLDSPPGAGKTGVVERLAVQAAGRMGERCMIATQTNEQAFDLARRLAQNYSRLDYFLFTKKGLGIPADLNSFPNLKIVESKDDLPSGPCVAIANAAKWSWLKGDLAPFDLQIVDEAFQLPDYRFQQIAGLARRFALVGDPGQIAPVVTCETERWKSDKAGPHVACPLALLERFPNVLRLTLPVSRRLVADTVRFVQPAFYKDLPFEALATPGSRSLTLSAPGPWRQPVDAALDRVQNGASLLSIELPPRITGEVDDEVSQTIVTLIERLIQRRAVLTIDGKGLPVDPGMIGVVCAHVSQVSAVRERLSAPLARVFVETSDRFQGLERPLMIVHHPLSGRADASEFHLDSGRLCVMMSRHTVACWLVNRGGIEDQLLRYAPVGNRILGIDSDEEYQGWQANLLIIQQLASAGRIVSL